MDSILTWDKEVFLLINKQWANPYFDSTFPVITDLHRSWPFQILMVCICFALPIYLYRKKSWVVILSFLFAVGISDWTGSQLFKKTVDRSRPFEVLEGVTQRSAAQPGKSFISNHAANMAAIAAVSFVFLPYVRWMMILFAFVAAYSRVYNGVHFPLDVLAGALWGASIGWLLAYFVSKNFDVKIARGAVL